MTHFALHTPPDLEAIKARLIRAGYPPPIPGESTHEPRRITREAQEARTELREHVIEDIWALIAALQSLQNNQR